MTKDMAIEVRDVQKRYGHIQALKGLTLDIAKGQIFGLIGANGAGKSTFIKLLVGISKADQGDLRIFGLDPNKHLAELRQQIGYMPQSPALYEDLSAADNLRFFGRAHRLSQLNSHVEEALDFVELSQRADDPVGNLSGGMRQRVSLACALVHQPRLLLLDEPTAGVDLKLRSAFWRHFKQLAEQGTTILVSTHQMDEAIHCNHLAIISQGEIIANDRPDNLLLRGRATVRIWRKGKPQAFQFEHYPEELAALLHAQGLDKEVQRVEIEPSSLEEIVLNMLEPSQDIQEIKDARLN
ncbi:MAG: ABC transporter ATP-binding protein [Chloroflexi bacterium]|nr:ABC transporter ATP-binding protein [Chloroflexota bacterium]